MLGFQGGVSIPLVKGRGESPAREAPVSSRAEGRARQTTCCVTQALKLILLHKLFL